MSSAAANRPVVLDASSVLALLFGEPGSDVVRAHVRPGVLGAVNLAEVLAKLSDHGMPASEAMRAVATLSLEVAPMTEAQALRSAELRPATRQAGLSLGDRACLTLAAEMGTMALTADRSWVEIAKNLNIAVEVIR